MFSLAKISKTLTILIVLGILMVGGLFVGLFAHSIQTALTLPTISAVTPVVTAAKPLATTPAQPHPTPTAQPSPVPTGTLAQDTFQRPDQTFWGTASNGQLWRGDANSSKVFAIIGGSGQVTGGGIHNAVLGPQSTNAEVVFSGSASSFGAGHSNFGALLRWTDSANWYKAYINGTSLIVIKGVNGSITRLQAVPFVAQGGTLYTLRFAVVGSTLAAKVWQSSDVEPANWMVVVTDTFLAIGCGGIRTLLGDGVVVKITAFLETVANTTV